MRRSPWLVALVALAHALVPACERGGGDAAPAAPEAQVVVPGLETALVSEEALREVVDAAALVAAEAEPPAARDARLALERAEARARLASQQLRRLEELSGDAIAPRKELESARAEGAAAAAAAERARKALAAFGAGAPGAALAAGETWVGAQLLQRDVPRVEAGAEARLRADAYPGRSFAGRVDAPPAYVDPQTGLAPVRVRVADPERALSPGMTGALAIDAGLPHRALVVPEAAVVYDGAQALVFVEEGGGRYTPRPVRLGAARDGRVAVEGALAAGARVVTTGAASLLSAARLPAGGGED